MTTFRNLDILADIGRLGGLDDHQETESRPLDYLLPGRLRTSHTLNMQRRKCPRVPAVCSQLFARTPIGRERVFERLFAGTGG